MRRTSLRDFAFVLAIALVPLAAAGQEPAARPQTKLVVQVEFFKGRAHAYDSVPSSSWFGRFMTTAAAKDRSPADTVRAVDVKTRLDGERVKIKVGVYVGERYFDRDFHQEIGAEGQFAQQRKPSKG